MHTNSSQSHESTVAKVCLSQRKYLYNMLIATDTFIPALLQLATAAGTAALGGSMREITPTKHRLLRRRSI